MAYGIAMNPDDPACPNFTPKTTEQTQPVPRTSPALYQSAAPPMQPAGNFPQFPQIGGRMNWYGMSGRGGGERGGGGAGEAAVEEAVAEAVEWGDVAEEDIEENG